MYLQLLMKKPVPLIGSEFPGIIMKQECEPYEYTISDTGEVITLNHRYVYLPEEPKKPQPKPAYQDFKPEVEAFSHANGKYAMAD